jgi:hypothetical protein
MAAAILVFNKYDTGWLCMTSASCRRDLYALGAHELFAAKPQLMTGSAAVKFMRWKLSAMILLSCSWHCTL